MPLSCNQQLFIPCKYCTLKLTSQYLLMGLLIVKWSSLTGGIALFIWNYFVPTESQVVSKFIGKVVRIIPDKTILTLKFLLLKMSTHMHRVSEYRPRWYIMVVYLTYRVTDCYKSKIGEYRKGSSPSVRPSLCISP